VRHLLSFNAAMDARFPGKRAAKLCQKHNCELMGGQMNCKGLIKSFLWRAADHKVQKHLIPAVSLQAVPTRQTELGMQANVLL
jgi:hypothetical protein